MRKCRGPRTHYTPGTKGSTIWGLDVGSVWTGNREVCEQEVHSSVKECWPVWPGDVLGCRRHMLVKPVDRHVPAATGDALVYGRKTRKQT